MVIGIIHRKQQYIYWGKNPSELICWKDRYLMYAQQKLNKHQINTESVRAKIITNYCFQDSVLLPKASVILCSALIEKIYCFKPNETEQRHLYNLTYYHDEKFITSFIKPQQHQQHFFMTQRYLSWAIRSRSLIKNEVIV